MASQSLPVTWILKDLAKQHDAMSIHEVLASIIDPSSYNLIYVPRERRKRNNTRYAFVNFVGPFIADSAVERLRAHLDMEPARMQGLPATLMTHDRWETPQELLLFHNGARIDKPTALALYASRGARIQRSRNLGLRAPIPQHVAAALRAPLVQKMLQDLDVDLPDFLNQVASALAQSELPQPPHETKCQRGAPGLLPSPEGAAKSNPCLSDLVARVGVPDGGVVTYTF